MPIISFFLNWNMDVLKSLCKYVVDNIKLGITSVVNYEILKTIDIFPKMIHNVNIHLAHF